MGTQKLVAMEEEEKKSIWTFEREPLMSNSQEKVEIETNDIDKKAKKEDTSKVENDDGFQSRNMNDLLEVDKTDQDIKDDGTGTSTQYEKNKVEKMKDEAET